MAPPWLSRMLVDTVGFRRAERMLQLGSLLKPEQALAAGLVDEVHPPWGRGRVRVRVLPPQRLP